MGGGGKGRRRRGDERAGLSGGRTGLAGGWAGGLANGRRTGIAACNSDYRLVTLEGKVRPVSGSHTRIDRHPTRLPGCRSADRPDGCCRLGLDRRAAAGAHAHIHADAVGRSLGRSVDLAGTEEHTTQRKLDSSTKPLDGRLAARRPAAAVGSAHYTEQYKRQQPG